MRRWASADCCCSGCRRRRTKQGSGAYADDGIVQQALRALQGQSPHCDSLVQIADVCLCEYTSHGHCGVLTVDGDHAHVENDASLPLLARTAASLARAGADVIAPSDMMDGRVAAMRQRDGRQPGCESTPILSYAAKFASAFYGPFRDAADSAPQIGDRRGYQMDGANVREAMREIEQDVAEGADMLLMKPAGPYLDVIRAARPAVRPAAWGLTR